MTAAESALAGLGRLAAGGDGAVDVGGAALLLAALTRSRLDREPYRRHLGQLSREVAAYAGSDGGGGPAAVLDRRADALGQVIARHHGYAGAEFAPDDVDGADFARVIDSRRGLSEPLGLLYLHAARAQGWQATALDFPGRLLVRLDHGATRRILDPRDGRPLGPGRLRALFKTAAGHAALLEPVTPQPITDRDALARLQSEAATRLARAGRLVEAVAAFRSMLLLAPGAAGGAPETEPEAVPLDQPRAAVGALEAYLGRAENSRFRDCASALLKALRQRLN